MHISEGVLSPQMLAAGWAITGVGTAVGLKKLDPDKIVRVAFISSAFFLASLIKIPIGPSSTHLSLIAPMGLILGWSIFPAVLTTLALQAILLRFGGFLALGANTVNFALPGLIVHLLLAAGVRRVQGRAAAALSFAAGFAGVILGAAGMGIFLWLSDPAFTNVAKFVFVAHAPLALVEGAITLFMVEFLKKTAPYILSGTDKQSGE